MLNFLRTTTTVSGLRVDAHLMRRKYEKGERISDKLFARLPLLRDTALPDWNYKLSPRKGEVISP